MRRFFLLFLLIPGFALVCGQVHQSCPLHDHDLNPYQNPLYEKWLSAYDIKGYDITLTVSNTETWIDGDVAVILEAVRDLDTLVLELQDALTVGEISLDNNTLLFEHKDNALYIPLDRTYHEGELLRVCILYEGDAGQNRGFFAGITTDTDFKYDFDVTYTLSEPHNASDWLPVKQVLVDKIDSVTFRVRCDKELLAGSNGLLTSIEEEGDDHVMTWKTNYPMAYYLISFAVADYRDFSFYAPLSEDGDSVLVQNYIYDSDLVFEEWESKIRMTGPMITAISKLLVDYPFAQEKYGHSMAPMGGGMEHQTMTTLQDFSFYLVAHELAHQWFGDYITCGNWQDVWINEGFASYFEYVVAQELLGQDAADGWMDNAMSIALSETRGSVFVPRDRVTDTYRLFDYGLSYKKGAILLHMIRYVLNDDELFFSVIRSYLQAFGNGLARGEDFQDVLEAESGMDFSCFFEQWYYGEGYPRFTVYWDQQGDSLKIESEQTATAFSVTPLFQIPFELEIRMEGGVTQRFRLMQSDHLEVYSLPVEGMVQDVIFDPDNHLLKTSSVIQELPSRRAFRYGPNPVTGKLFIQFPNAGNIDQVRITSMSGQEVMKLSDMANPTTMDLSALADGQYLLELTNSRGTYLERIVKISEE